MQRSRWRKGQNKQCGNTFFYPELDEMSKLDGGMIEFDDHKVFTPISSSIFFRLLQDQIRLSLFKHYSFNTKTIYQGAYEL